MESSVRVTLAGAAVLVAAAGNLLAIVLLPWAHYGALTMGLDRFPGWPWHATAVAVLYAAALWALLAAPQRRRPVIVLSALAGLAAAGSAVALALRYDEASLFFDRYVPAVIPAHGTGAPVAVLSVLVCLTAVGSRWPRSTGAG
ncbi:hypothetical protein [Micromonospora radicis]|uniref:DUF998 domain-containing protein n=1 Tax=Micromonospora radicis TaxID=1894971 RepID=A0A418MRQ5_9ACTN|nr:hypothetical protein [Micromonospora radicis]RIV36612.1 hypothetical protein D2L64_19335 [Micromonospora radicis]